MMTVIAGTRFARDVCLVEDPAETAASKRHYPKLNKRDLFSLGYIASYSGHSTELRFDLTLVICLRQQGCVRSCCELCRCTQPPTGARLKASIDMGTGYDCFDVVAHTRAAAISAEQRKWRQTLIARWPNRGCQLFPRVVALLAAAGGGTAVDFPIPPRPADRRAADD